MGTLPTVKTFLPHPAAGYRSLPGIAPYSCGVIAQPGHEMIRMTFASPLPWRTGFERVDAFLRSQGLRRTDLCAMELRSPRPFSMEGFIAFNRDYCRVLGDWGLLGEQTNPIARTNVCPLHLGFSEPVLHAFSVVRPNPELNQRTFIVAGAGELREGTLVSDGIVRRGETSAEALVEKARYVCDVMAERLSGLGAVWEDVTAVNVYTVHPIHELVESVLWERIPAARAKGIQWHRTRPPVIDIEFEMDLHGIVTQRNLVF